MKLWQIIILVVAGIAGIAVVTVTQSMKGLKEALYPAAPPMPQVVSATMPEVLTRLENVLRTNAPHVLESLQPGLSADALERLQTGYSVRLPEEIQAIYRWRNGSALTTNGFAPDFIPGHRFVPLEEALEQQKALSAAPDSGLLSKAAYKMFVEHRKSWIALFEDAAGDGYWFDLGRKPEQGSVFFCFTETGYYVFFPSPKNLMSGVAECHELGVFKIKEGSSPPELEEDFERSLKVWNGFGASTAPD